MNTILLQCSEVVSRGSLKDSCTCLALLGKMRVHLSEDADERVTGFCIALGLLSLAGVAESTVSGPNALAIFC